MNSAYRNSPVPFTLSGAITGAKRCLPIEVGGFTMGLVFGVLARQAGLSPAEAVLMSALVFSGATQFVVLGMWRGRSDVLPWVVAACVAVATHHWLGGQWYILLGGLAGSLAGVVRSAS